MYLQLLPKSDLHFVSVTLKKKAFTDATNINWISDSFSLFTLPIFFFFYLDEKSKLENALKSFFLGRQNKHTHSPILNEK